MDAETKVLVSLVHGPSRDQKTCDKLVEDFATRTGLVPPSLVTTDEHAPYKNALLKVYGVEEKPRRKTRTGQKAKPKKRLPAGMVYATVHKTREKGRVVDIRSKLVLGKKVGLEAALEASTSSSSVNTSFIERHNGTTRHFNARKQRKTYCFSKQMEEHVAMSWLMITHDNFCWAHRSLREEIAPRKYLRRSPAVAAGLVDHVWTVAELLTMRLPGRR